MAYDKTDPRIIEIEAENKRLREANTLLEHQIKFIQEDLVAANEIIKALKGE